LFIAENNYFTRLFDCSSHGYFFSSDGKLNIGEAQVEKSAKLKAVAFKSTCIIKFKLALAQFFYGQLSGTYNRVAVDVFASKKGHFLWPVCVLVLRAEIAR